MKYSAKVDEFTESMLLSGGVSDSEWEAVLGESYASFVQPVVDAIDVKQEHFSRNDMLRDAFNSLAGVVGSRDVAGVRNFYCDPKGIFARVLAYECGKDQGARQTILGGFEHFRRDHAARKYAALDEAISRFPKALRALDHGCGRGDVGLGIVALCVHATVDLYDYMTPSRIVVFNHILRNMPKYFSSRIKLLDASSVKVGVSSTRSFVQAARDFGKYGFVISTDVLEHVLDPAEELGLIHSCMEPGGIIYLSTFFNSCNGNDPQHLDEHVGLQDTAVWFKLVDDIGFRLIGKDDNGCEKIWEKV